MTREIDFEHDYQALQDELLESYGVDGREATFAITDMDTASWASRKLQADEQEKRRVDDWAAREIARIKAIQQRHIDSIDNRMGFLLGHLHTYLDRLIREGEIKRKSLDLPGGKIAIRTGRAKIVIDDEDAAIEYLEAADETAPIKVKKSILKTELGKVSGTKGAAVILNATGEPLPGVHAEPAEDSFSFKPALEE